MAAQGAVRSVLHFDDNHIVLADDVNKTSLTAEQLARLQESSQSVCCIETEFTCIATGFLLPGIKGWPPLVATAGHVAEFNQPSMDLDPHGTLWANFAPNHPPGSAEVLGKRVRLALAFRDGVTDLAFMYVDEPAGPPAWLPKGLKFYSFKIDTSFDSVAAIGFPGSSDCADPAEAPKEEVFGGHVGGILWLSQGKVTEALHYTNFFWHDSPTLPGSSGSPVLNMTGQVIGVHFTGGHPVKGGCALYSKRVKLIYESLRTPPAALLARTSNVAEELHKAWERYALQIELDQLESFYVPLDCQPHKESIAARRPVRETVNTFLQADQERHRVLLLQGDAGTGKTTLSLLLMRRMWQDFAIRKAIPVRIEMRRYNATTAESCVDDALGDKVARLKELELPVIFIFDGYDEVAGGGYPRLWQANKLDDFPAGSKAIITCRPEYLAGQSYETLLGPTIPDTASSQLVEWFISPFKREQISAYLRNVQERDTGVAAKEYEAFLKANAEVCELVSTPFLLKIFVGAFPRLQSKQPAAKSSPRFTRGDLYHAFMEEWFRKEERKLVESTGQSFSELKETFATFSQSLAFGMFKEKVIQVVFREIAEQKIIGLNKKSAPAAEPNTWSKWFSNTNPEVVRARRGCPLRSLGGTTFSFVHKSFLEYFVAEELWRVLRHGRGKELVEVWGARCLTKEPKMPAVISFLADKLMALPAQEPCEEFATKRPRSESSGPRSGDSSVDSVRESLLWLIDRSKREHSGGLSPKRQQSVLAAASNAITVLNKSCFPFSVKAQEDPTFFRGIQVPYADLSMAQLWGVDLTGADLSNCLLISMKLSGGNLSGCNMTGVAFARWPMLKFTKRVRAVALTADGQRMAVAAKEKLHLFSKMPGNSRKWQEDCVLKGHTHPVNSVAWSHDGSHIVSGSSDMAVRVWDTKTGSENLVLRGHAKAVASVAWSPDGSQVVSGSDDGTVRVWDVLTGRLGSVLAEHTKAVTSVAWSPDGRLVVSGGKDKTVRVWDASTSSVGTVLRGHTSAVTSVAWSPDGRLVVSGSDDMTVRVWDASKSSAGPVLRGHSSKISSVAWSADGRWIVSGSDDMTIRVWDAKTGNAGIELQGHEEVVSSVAWSPDGRQVVSGGGNGSVRLWDAKTGNAGPVLQGHTAAVNSVAWSPDSRRVVSGGFDKTVRVWEMVPNEEGTVAGMCWKTLWAFPPNGPVELRNVSWAGAFGLPEVATEVLQQFSPSHAQGSDDVS